MPEPRRSDARPPREPGLGWVIFMAFALFPATVLFVWFLQAVGLLNYQ